MKKKYLSGTIGMMAFHPALGEAKLVRVEYRESKGEVFLVPVSGYNLEPIKIINQVKISKEEYENRPYDPCDDTVEFFWAARELGFVFSDEYDERDDFED